jgi:hypothetical protein
MDFVVPGFVCDEIDRSFVDLMLDGAVEHVQRLAGALVQELVEQERKPTENVTDLD